MTRYLSLSLLLILLAACDTQAPEVAPATVAQADKETRFAPRITISGTSSAPVGAFGSWNATVRAPSGVSEVQRTWHVDDGNDIIHTETGNSLVYAFQSAPDNPVGYHIIVNVTFSNGETRGNIYPVEVTGGGAGGDGQGDGGCTGFQC